MPFSMLMPAYKVKTGKLIVSCNAMRGGPFRLMVSMPHLTFQGAFDKAETVDLHWGNGVDAGKLLITAPAGGGAFQADLPEACGNPSAPTKRSRAGLQNGAHRSRAPSDERRLADHTARMGVEQGAAEGDQARQRTGRKRGARQMRALLTVLCVGLFPPASAAHDAPKGWKYDFQCCSNYDCREIRASDVDEVWNGYLIKLSKMQEIVPYGSPKIKDSPDGLYHWCSQGGADTGKTLCLYVPPRGY